MFYPKPFIAQYAPLNIISTPNILMNPHYLLHFNFSTYMRHIHTYYQFERLI